MKRIIFVDLFARVAAVIIVSDQIFFPGSMVIPAIIILIHILQPAIRLFKIYFNGKV